jgi:hypothetical protein
LLRSAGEKLAVLRRAHASSFPIEKDQMMNENAPKAKATHLWTRAKDEWYVEPLFVTNALFDVEKFDGGIWDPACGRGNILIAAMTNTAMAFGHGDNEIIGSDIVQRGCISQQLWLEKDFLKCADLLAPNIITNPPARLAELFIRHALSLHPEKLAVFVNARFLFSTARAKGLWADLAPARIWFVNPLLSCPPGEWLLAGNKAGGGTHEYCWLVWDRWPNNSPIAGWLVARQPMSNNP